MKGIRSISRKAVPIYAWQSCASVAVLGFYGPESMGGHGNLRKKIEAIKENDEEEWKRKVMHVSPSTHYMWSNSRV